MAGSPASFPFTVLLGVLVALTALGMDMFLPSVPVIARAFAGDSAAAQLAVTTYLLGLALGQLVWGPVSDRYGRRPVLLLGLSVFLASAAWGAMAASMTEMAALRFLQGIAMSSGPVIARSIVRDLYAREQAADESAVARERIADRVGQFGIVAHRGVREQFGTVGDRPHGTYQIVADPRRKHAQRLQKPRPIHPAASRHAHRNTRRLRMY